MKLSISKKHYMCSRKRLKKGEKILLRPHTNWNQRAYVYRKCSIYDPKIRFLKMPQGYDHRELYTYMDIKETLKAGLFIIY